MGEDRRARVLWVTVAVVVAVAAAAVVLVGVRRDRGRVAAPVEGPAAPRFTGAVETRSVGLYFSSLDGEQLVWETREIVAGGGVEAEVLRVLQALARGPRGEGEATLPPETTVRSAFLDPTGRLYLDLGPELRAHHGGGTRGELTTLGSILRTIAANFPEVRAVQFLERGQPIETLAGHVDLARPLWVDDWR